MGSPESWRAGDEGSGRFLRVSGRLGAQFTVLKPMHAPRAALFAVFFVGWVAAMASNARMATLAPDGNPGASSVRDSHGEHGGDKWLRVRRVQSLRGLPAQASGSIFNAEAIEAVLDRYCVTCHNQRLRTAGLTLDTLNVAAPGTQAEV